VPRTSNESLVKLGYNEQKEDSSLVSVNFKKYFISHNEQNLVIMTNIIFLCFLNFFHVSYYDTARLAHVAGLTQELFLENNF